MDSKRKKGMGAPKQKWTAEEEAALKAGVTKHGTGKWRTILSDSEFSMVLKSRSNIDLKDKWRNISVTAVYGSRTKAKQARRSLPVPEEDDNNNASAVSIVPSANVEERANASSPGGSGETSRRSLHSLDNVILEAITNLKEPHGSDRTAIFEYIEENFKTRANLKWHVLERLEHLTSNGTLVKIEHKYRFSSVGARQESPQLFSEGNGSNIPFKSRRDGELRINGLTVHEAAEAAARAIAEAEFASAEAREAEKEAERLEAEAEAAEIFAIAAMKALKLSMRNQAS